MIQSATQSLAQPFPSIRHQGEDRAPDEPATGKPEKSDELSTKDQKDLQSLRARDREVRAHEQAHQAAGGQYVTSGASYSYEQGPDGQRYAVGGEVGIDTSAESDPEATILKMQVVRAAALAPASPSGQDRKVAAQASRTAAQARTELRQERTEESKENETSNPPGSLIDIRA